MTTSADLNSLERKLRMYEAREAILSRIVSETFSVINLDHFLRGAVTEVGKMMDVDRSDAISFTPEGVLRITHEYRADEDAPKLLGLELKVDFERLQETIDLYNPLVIEETSSPDLPLAVQRLVENLGSRSALFVPITFNLQLLGMIGLHHSRRSYHWSADEIDFIRNLAQQIAIGYRYTHIYSEKEREARITKALLEIANDINTGSDFSEVTERILDRALDLLNLQGACLAVLDANNSEIHFSNLRTSSDDPADVLKRPSLKFPILELLPKRVDRGQMLKILSPDQHEYARSFLKEVFSAGAAIVAPIIIEDKIFGALVLLWSEPQQSFVKEQTALALGIADQLAIAASKARLSAEVMRLRRELEHAQTEHSDIGFVGKSDIIMRSVQMAMYVADSYTTVLLQGESGTGKEMMADLIQSRSPRKDKPYIKINCGAIPESLLESELFGHEKGAFTDARARRLGKFEEVRLLRVLQNGEFTRVGGNEVIKTDVRVIAASNIDMEEAVREARFRRDLYYRLNVYPIKLPPLRERRDDVPLLATHFLETYKKRSNKNITGITKKAMTWLRRYDWPGNVRELENAVERAVIIAQGRLITVDDLPDAVRGAETSRSIELEVGTTIDEAEKRMILQTLAYTRGDRSRAAQILGIGRKTLYRKLQRYNHENVSE
jgi:transcriptional regulator with GAF, ATPase, and Fis domain